MVQEGPMVLMMVWMIAPKVRSKEWMFGGMMVKKGPMVKKYELERMMMQEADHQVTKPARRRRGRGGDVLRHRIL